MQSSARGRTVRCFLFPLPQGEVVFRQYRRLLLVCAIHTFRLHETVLGGTVGTDAAAFATGWISV